ncbi:MAG TPA: hypothetical protein PLV82_03585 [bacterium]|nr:hypothetical protein [bacterium]
MINFVLGGLYTVVVLLIGGAIGIYFRDDKLKKVTNKIKDRNRDNSGAVNPRKVYKIDSDPVRNRIKELNDMQ